MTTDCLAVKQKPEMYIIVETQGERWPVKAHNAGIKCLSNCINYMPNSAAIVPLRKK